MFLRHYIENLLKNYRSFLPQTITLHQQKIKINLSEDINKKILLKRDKNFLL
jgi:hypothetical protein